MVYIYTPKHSLGASHIALCIAKNEPNIPFGGDEFTFALFVRFARTLFKNYSILLSFKPKKKTHPFDSVCNTNQIEHRLTKFKHPWTNVQVKIFNKTIKNATTKTYHYETIDELKRHLMSYLLYCNHQKKLKKL